ncbi:hypothetical protein [Cerasicoccus maritimus]|uniref:hypothetical protein n=1 Tax=Cerasicoccus maritimus TaxID=490089 RepID=UPI0028527D09|nr:hypothetical protein [Cerasicoccus maritimus]
MLGDKRRLELYPCRSTGTELDTRGLPDGYTATLSAKRYDGLVAGELFSLALTAEAGQDGHTRFVGTVDISGAVLDAAIALDDQQLLEGFRARVQVKFAAGDNSEIFRPSFLVVIRNNIDA